MFSHISRPVRRAASVAAVLAAAAVLAMTTAKVAPTSPTAPRADRAAHTDQAPLIQQAAGTGTGMFPLLARTKDGHLYDYEPTGTGGFGSKFDLGGGYNDTTALAQAPGNAEVTVKRTR